MVARLLFVLVSVLSMMAVRPAEITQNLLYHIRQPSFDELNAARLMFRAFSAGP
jgi:hypothetical protein